MKLFFASDLHGSLYYTRLMMRAFENEQADKLILLGDLLYHGPRNPLPRDYDPMGVAETLNEKRSHILAVRGNCDAEVDQMVLSFPMRQDSLSLFDGTRHLFVTHGHLFSCEQPPLLTQKDMLINGHFHEAALENTGAFFYANPGSVSLPKDGFRGYLLCHDGVFSLKTLEGEVIKTLEPA